MSLFVLLVKDDEFLFTPVISDLSPSIALW